MQSVSTPLARLHEDGSWFARAHELRLWLVRCDASLRGPALALLPKFEFHADNRCAWTVLPDAHTATDEGWTPRANRLIADWVRRVEAFAADGVEQGPAQVVHGASGPKTFAGTVLEVLTASRAPLAGLALVLAPTIVSKAAAFESVLRALVIDPKLARVRWIVVLDVDVEIPRGLLDELGPERSLVTECAIDPAEQRRELKAMLAGDPARLGVAFPVGVTPPRRVDDPPPLAPAERDAALRAGGVDPALLEHGPELRAEVLRAALAMAEGRGPAAIEHQRRASALCKSLTLFEAQVIAQITLASYLSAEGRRPEARSELKGAIETARAHALARPESLAHLALGLLHNLDREPQAAIRAYLDAARTAEGGAEPVLAIEGFRMAGQLSAQCRQEPQAEAAFRDAIRVATGAGPKVARGSSAAEAARQLAVLCAQRGMSAQAASLHAQANAIERGGADARQ